ncbi:hypothetical protein N7474_003704 [Penicillium riverlandense]|uniref:uncharacterized protein n=1 Tax=Penicillium riverlandense TaxID=1903569 RepID=UPI0025469CC0|nr:uncharacterized protein N7474_003704 [Penicillium riverlandense]KAJ5818113.1 hypothetical protein N7474_003704 [Penicillium riverlandense]
MDAEAGKYNDSQETSPGTVRLQARDDDLILSPRPSSDPNDPLNWAPWRKWLQIALLSLYTVLVDACLVVATPMWAVMNKDPGFSYTALNDSYAVATGALALGCFILVPFALRYGRRPIYILTSAIVTGMGAWSAAMTTTGELYATQAIMCFVGVVNETLFEISVADMFFVHERGTFNGVYYAMVVIGNFFAPVPAGYVTASQGWRWGYWYVAIFNGALTLAMIFLLEETKYVPSMVIEGSAIAENPESPEEQNPEKAKPAPNDGVSSESENITSSHKRRHIDSTIPIKPYWKRMSLIATTPSSLQHENHNFARHFWQPFVVLCLFPAIAFGALQWGFAFSSLSVMLVTQAAFYPAPPYNFSPIGVGNVIIAPAIGGILGSIVGGIATDWLILKLARRNKGIYEPEMRLQMFIVPGVALPVGIFMYGLTISTGLPWIINCVGAGFVGFGIGGCGTIVVTYIQDSYSKIIGDGFVGVTFVRNLLATIFVFAIPAWEDGMGAYNMFVLLGCLAVLVVATYVPMLIWGKKWRRQYASRYEFYARRQYETRPE